MDVTIISNGTDKLVLRAKNPKQKLALQDLSGKPLTATFYDKPTQILDESYTDCMVIQASKEQVKESFQLAEVTEGPTLFLPFVSRSYNQMMSFITTVLPPNSRIEDQGEHHEIINNETEEVIVTFIVNSIEVR